MTAQIERKEKIEKKNNLEMYRKRKQKSIEFNKF